jgi:hypothetical protein
VWENVISQMEEHPSSLEGGIQRAVAGLYMFHSLQQASGGFFGAAAACQDDIPKVWC